MSQSLPLQLLKELSLKGYSPRIGIEIQGLNKYFSPFKTFTSDLPRTYVGEILGAPKISLDVDRMGGFVKAGGMSMSVLNQELFSDIFASGTDPYPENEEVIVKLFCDDGTDILDAESVQIFKGVISDFPTIDYGSVDFNIERYDLIKETTIGEILTDSDAADTDQGLPDDSRGKIKPIIYGDHEFLRGDDDRTEDTVSGENNMSPCVYLGLDSSNRHRWWVAAHEVNLLRVTGTLEHIWGWDSVINRHVRLSGVTVEQNDLNGCIISHVNEPYFFDYWYAKGTVVGSISGSGTTSNPERAGDKAFDTSGELAGNLAAVSGSWQQFSVPFADYDDQNLVDTDISEIKIFVYGKLTHLGVASDGDHEVQMNGGSGLQSLSTQYPTSGSYPTARLYIINGTDTNSDISNAIIIRLTKQNNNADTGATFDVYEIYKSIRYTRRKILPLFFAGKGREYEGTWVNNRTQTENHIDNGRGDPTNGLNENAAGIIESIARDEIGLADAEIDLAQFNIASNDLSTSKLSFSITEQIKATELIDSIAKTVKSAIFYDFDNELNMKVFVSGDPFSASGDSVANNQDIFEFDPQSVFKIVAGENNKLDFKDSIGIPRVATISAGEYTGSNLATEIDNKMTAETPDTFTITYNSTTGKFTLQDTSGGYQLLWNSGANVSTSIGRFIGFNLSSDDTGAGSYTSDYSLWADSFVEQPITEESFRLRKTEEDIVTSLTLNYFPNHEGNFQASRTATDNTYHAETLEGTFEHPFTRDQTTADIYRDFLVKSDGTGRLSKRYYEMESKTWLNGVITEPFDIINNRHPILAGIFGSDEDTLKWGIVGILIDLESMEVEITSTQLTTP